MKLISMAVVNKNKYLLQTCFLEKEEWVPAAFYETRAAPHKVVHVHIQYIQLLTCQQSVRTEKEDIVISASH